MLYQIEEAILLCAEDVAYGIVAVFCDGGEKYGAFAKQTGPSEYEFCATPPYFADNPGVLSGLRTQLLRDCGVRLVEIRTVSANQSRPLQ